MGRGWEYLFMSNVRFWEVNWMVYSTCTLGIASTMLRYVLVICWACYPEWLQHHGFDSPRSLQVEGIFPLELTWVLTTSPKTLSDESINRPSVWAHLHSIAQTQKILTFMSKTDECWQQKHTQHVPSTKTKCNYLYGWIKICFTYAKFSPKNGGPQRYSRECRRRRNVSTKSFGFLRLSWLSLLMVA